jgi:hypothetical protein
MEGKERKTQENYESEIMMTAVHLHHFFGLGLRKFLVLEFCCTECTNTL